MKARLLIGLLTVALGGLTSCSNILEENGVINNVAENGMGELRISLEQNPAVNVITKAGSFNDNKVTLSEEEINAFTITVGGVPELSGNYGDIKEKTVTVVGRNYPISAEYGKMTDKFAFNAPYFSGSDNYEVKKDYLNIATVNCTLQNSIIVIDPTAFDEFKSKLTINSVVAYAGEVNNTTDLSTGTSLIDQDKNLKNGTLYVKSDLTDAKIVVEGCVKNDPSRTFKAIADITNTTDNSVGKAKKYIVKYQLFTDSGSLKIAISVNGIVSEQTISVNVNPYNPENNTQQ